MNLSFCVCTFTFHFSSSLCAVSFIYLTFSFWCHSKHLSSYLSLCPFLFFYSYLSIFCKLAALVRHRVSLFGKECDLLIFSFFQQLFQSDLDCHSV